MTLPIGILMKTSNFGTLVIRNFSYLCFPFFIVMPFLDFYLYIYFLRTFFSFFRQQRWIKDFIDTSEKYILFT